MGKPWPQGPMSVAEIVPKSIVAQPEIKATIEAAKAEEVDAAAA